MKKLNNQFDIINDLKTYATSLEDMASAMSVRNDHNFANKLDKSARAMRKAARLLELSGEDVEIPMFLRRQAN